MLRSSKVISATVIGGAVLAVLVLLMPRQQAAAQGQGKGNSGPIVEIGSPLPLPVDVTNVVPVDVEGELDLSPNPGAPIHVVHAPEKIRQQGFGATKDNDTDGFIRVPTMFVVPPDTRAVVEYVSFEVEIPAGQSLTHVRLSTPSVGIGSGTRALLVPKFIGTASGQNVFVGSEPVRLYFEPGDEIRFTAVRNSQAEGTMSVNAFIHGYLIPLP